MTNWEEMEMEMEHVERYARKNGLTFDEAEKILTCSDCPPDDCTGHCCSCPYGAQ